VPGVVFAVNVGAVATPLESVVAVFTPPVNVPLAPDDGAINVTVAPLVGVPPVVTVATNGAANATPTAALCPDPLVTAMDTTGDVLVPLLLPPPQATRPAIVVKAASKKID